MYLLYLSTCKTTLHTYPSLGPFMSYPCVLGSRELVSQTYKHIPTPVPESKQHINKILTISLTV